MKNISKAIIQVMNAVAGVEKNTTIGKGNYAYKGVTDKDVKDVFKPALAAAGLSIMPINIDDDVRVDRWTEGDRTKQAIFVSVKVKYLLLHESGESIELMGYGHGVDPQDKSAGKATTYALKNCLLYTFLTPVGAMDDADTTHSEDIPTPQPKKKPVDKIELRPNTMNFDTVLTYLNQGGDFSQLSKKYSISEEVKAEILKQVKP